MPATGQARIEARERWKARRRGEDVPLRMRMWTADEVATLRAAYERYKGKKEPWLGAVAAQLGREKANVCTKARKLGLTDIRRTRSGKRRRPRQMSIWTLLPPLARMGGARGTFTWEGRQHPRGMLGKTHTPEVRMKISQFHRGRPHPHSEETIAKMSRARAELLRTRPEAQHANRGKGGRRVDLDNRYFRSKWEANYARYLNYVKKPWEFETKTFWFEDIKRGARSYTPDFYLPDENCYHEVKGWMDPKSATKLKRMAKRYPDVKVVVIGKEWFQQAEKSGLCGIIPHWECKHKKW